MKRLHNITPYVRNLPLPDTEEEAQAHGPWVPLFLVKI